MSCDTCFEFSRDCVSNISIDRLQSSVDSGCQYCALVHRCLVSQFHLEDIRQLHVLNKDWGQMCIFVAVSLREGYRVKHGNVGRNSSTFYEEIFIFVPEGRESPGDWITMRHNVPEPSSEDTFRFIQDNLRECLDTHNSICPQSPGAVFPTRVVQLGTDRDSLRIVQYNKELGPYLALSHCWGGSQNVRLTSKSHCFFQNLPFEILPATFQDAVEVTRKLGFNHIWIDSLCIMQDDSKDWEIECARMGDVYRNAILTIAATSSADSSKSFLRPAQKSNSPKVDVLFRDKDGKEFPLQALRDPPYHAESTHYTEGPLNMRAWCLQEDLLSTRLVRYQNTDIQWRCVDREVCQCMGPSVKYEDSLGRVRALSQCNESDGQEIWCQVVRNFSFRHLTVASDRLPALAGIASLFQETFQWTYAAGLWKEWLLPSLCWQSYRNDDVRQMPLEPVAPSFSWASVRVAAYFYPMSGTAKTVYRPTQLMGVDTVIKGENIFGEVNRGFIELKGPIVEAHLWSLDTSNWDEYLVEHPSVAGWILFPDTTLAEQTIGDLKVAARCFDNRTETLQNVRVWVVCLALNESGIDAIALRPLDDSGKNFERIGLLDHRGPKLLKCSKLHTDLSGDCGDDRSRKKGAIVSGEDDALDGYMHESNPSEDESWEDSVIEGENIAKGKGVPGEEDELGEPMSEDEVSMENNDSREETKEPRKLFTSNDFGYDPPRAWRILLSEADQRRVKVF